MGSEFEKPIGNNRISNPNCIFLGYNWNDDKGLTVLRYKSD